MITISVQQLLIYSLLVVAIIAIGVVYILVRCLGKYLGASVSSRAVGCSDTVVKYLGITLFPQAGVALGMVVTAQTLGETEGALVRNITLFSVLVYELVGPMLTKMALTKAGDIHAIPQEVAGRRSRRLKEITKPVPPSFDK